MSYVKCHMSRSNWKWFWKFRNFSKFYIWISSNLTTKRRLNVLGFTFGMYWGRGVGLGWVELSWVELNRGYSVHLKGQKWRHCELFYFVISNFTNPNRTWWGCYDRDIILPHLWTLKARSLLSGCLCPPYLYLNLAKGPALNSLSWAGQPGSPWPLSHGR